MFARDTIRETITRVYSTGYHKGSERFRDRVGHFRFLGCLGFGVGV